ncbi:hypothetical protein [Chondromyces apiculatus]|nr:hypothetical protein [Chondromyces apiculatus]
MKHRTSLPILATLFTLLLVLPACDDGGGGGEGGDPTASSGGAGGTGAGGTGAGGTGAGGTENGWDPDMQQCGEPARSVGACLYPGPSPAGSEDPPSTFAKTATVVAIRLHSDQDYCFAGGAPLYWVGARNFETVLDLVDEEGTEINLSLGVGDFDMGELAVGDVLQIEASHYLEYEIIPTETSSIRVSRDGQLLVAAGSNDPLGLNVSKGGPSTCRVWTDYVCSIERAPMAVQAGDASEVTLDAGESAEVGDLTVINHRFHSIYDITGSCNFGTDVEYVIGAYTTPSP